MAKSISDTQRLQALDEKQARIVYFIRHGYSNKDIGEALGELEPKTVSDYMAPIYDTLDIHIDNPNAKRQEIVNRYAEIIDRLIPSDSVLEYWEAKPLPSDLEEKETGQPGAEEDKSADIGAGAIDIGETQSDTDQSESILQELDELGRRQGIEEPPPPRRIPRWLFVVISLLVMCIACTLVTLFGISTIRPFIVNAIAQIQATPIPTDLQEPSTAQEVPLDTAADPTNTIEQLPTSTTAAGVDQQGLPTLTNTSLPPTPTLSTPTPTPTNTLTPTPTNTSTPTDTMVPTPSALFHADFENGMPDGMDMVYGEASLVNGKLIAQELTLLSMGDETWSNYEVEYETKKHTYCWGLENNGVAAHASDPDNMVIFSWNYCESAWYELINGNWEIIEGSHQGNVANPGTTITIRLVAEGEKYTVYINNKNRSSMVKENYTQGKVYIQLSKESVVDNILIRALP